MKKCEFEKISLWGAEAADLMFSGGEIPPLIYIPHDVSRKEHSIREIEVSDRYAPEWKTGRVRLYIPNGESPAGLPDGDVVLSDGATGAPLCVFNDGNFYFSFDPMFSIRMILEEKYFHHAKNPFMKAPVHYHKIPGPARLAASKSLYGKEIRDGGSEGFPSWPLERSIDAVRFALLKASGAVESKIVDWPKGKKFCVVLSHDVDTDGGVRGAEKIAELENSRGVSSCWCVPYTVITRNRDFVRNLVQSGHELAIHGYNHDNRIAHLPAEEIAKRINDCADMARDLGAQGFRSPSLLVSDDLYSAIQGKFSWSSSVIDSDVNSIIGPRRGCATVFPFYRGNVLEIPLTVPFEDKLIVMGKTPDEMFQIQSGKIADIADAGGIAVYGNHTERHLSGAKKYFAVYETVLDNLLSMDGAWIASPSALEKFWRERFPLR